MCVGKTFHKDMLHAGGGVSTISMLDVCVWGGGGNISMLDVCVGGGGNISMLDVRNVSLFSLIEPLQR